MNRACEHPPGCNHEAEIEVSDRWLCIRHAGEGWDARRVENRAAGLCRCGKPPAAGRRSCPDCLRDDAFRAARHRNARRHAVKHGITLAPGEGRAFFREWMAASKVCSRSLKRSMNRARARMRYGVQELEVSVIWDWRGVKVTETLGGRIVVGRGLPER